MRPCQRCGAERPPGEFLFCSMKCRVSHYSKPSDAGCWVWQLKLDSYGYGRTNVRSQPVKAHRASYEAFVGPIKAGALVCHRCDNRACVNPDHLFLGTHADNSADMTKKSRQARGARLARSKLSEADVRAIRADARPHSKIAPLYGVSRTQIRYVRERKVWRHVV